MNAIDKIEKILINERIGIAEFLEKTSMSKSSYYAIKNGKAENISVKVANKISETFPDYTYDWLMDVSEKLPDVLKETESSYNTDLEKLALKVVDNQSELMKIKIFSNIIELEVAKRLIEISTSKEKFNEFLNN